VTSLHAAKLALNKQTGKHCPFKCTSFVSEKNAITHWVFKLNIALPTAESWG